MREKGDWNVLNYRAAVWSHSRELWYGTHQLSFLTSEILSNSQGATKSRYSVPLYG